MKHAVLRAAAHNLADSISSEFCMVAHYPGFYVWEEIAQLPRKQLTVDLISGRILSWVNPLRVRRFLRLRRFFHHFAKHVPDFLRRHGCVPTSVRSIEIEFRDSPRRTWSQREVFVTVEQADGRKTVDRYIGLPLKRPRRLDPQGRIRRDKKPQIKC